MAHDACEALRVVGLARGAQDPVADGAAALAALLQGVHVVGVAERLAVNRVEWLAYNNVIIKP